MADPLGTDEDVTRSLEGLCAKRHIRGAKFLFNSQTALGTATGYRPVINDFKDHCLSSPGMSYDDFGSKEVISFIMEVAMKKDSKAYMAKVKPAISRLEMAMNRHASQTCFTPMVDAILLGRKRVSAEIAPTIKKMDPVPK